MSSLESSRLTAIAKLSAASPTILPSMLLCDFGNLQREISKLEEAGVEALHLDVMDGHFVPNLTYGMPIVEAIRRLTNLTIDVHLMISDPALYAPQFVDAGADSITFHVEAIHDPLPLLDRLQSNGVAAGLAINPSTSMDRLHAAAGACDLVLVMSVEPGFGGQGFNSVALKRLAALRDTLGSDVLLEVDGGVNASTIGACRQAGADLLVVGSAIFRQADYGQAVKNLIGVMQSVD